MATMHRELMEFDYIEERFKQVLKKITENDPKQSDILYRASVMEYNTAKLLQRAVYEKHYQRDFSIEWLDDFIDAFAQLFLLAILKKQDIRKILTYSLQKMEGMEFNKVSRKKL